MGKLRYNSGGLVAQASRPRYVACWLGSEVPTMPSVRPLIPGGLNRLTQHFILNRKMEVL